MSDSEIPNDNMTQSQYAKAVKRWGRFEYDESDEEDLAPEYKDYRTLSPENALNPQQSKKRKLGNPADDKEKKTPQRSSRTHKGVARKSSASAELRANLLASIPNGTALPAPGPSKAELRAEISELKQELTAMRIRYETLQGNVRQAERNMDMTLDQMMRGNK